MKDQLYTNFRWWANGQPQSMLVEGGRIVYRRESLPGDAGLDLAGRIMLPGFIDSHCHILPTGLDLQKLNLDSANSHEAVLEMVRKRHSDQPEGWLLAVHYDQTRYEGIHLHRSQLDAISDTRPILLRHVNGHAAVANSAALIAGRVNSGTIDPSGGSFGRDADGELDGLLLEEAMDPVSGAIPTPTLDEMIDAILRAGEKMAACNIICASDMMTGRFNLRQELEAYRQAATRGCPIDMRLYVQWRDVLGPRAQPLEFDGDDRVRIAGLKIFADGAIGSATAAIYGKYASESVSGKSYAPRAKSATESRADVSGQLIYPPGRLNEMVSKATDAGWQVSVHAIGDYAADLVMDAFEASSDAKRHRIEHAMMLSDSQIERLARLGCFVTFQPEFLMRFGHSYKRQLGHERAARLKRTRSVLDAGIPLSFSSDRPIVGGDPWDGIRTAVHRPEGFDSAENCTLPEAIRAYTSEGARANGDQNTGSLEPGQPALFQLVDSLPEGLVHTRTR